MASGSMRSRNQLPPAAVTASSRAWDSGDGAENGSRSIATTESAAPGTSTPCQNDLVAQRMGVAVLHEHPQQLSARHLALPQTEQPVAKAARQLLITVFESPVARKEQERASLRGRDQAF